MNAELISSRDDLSHEPGPAQAEEELAPVPAGVDSYRFLDRITGKLVKDWIEMETPREIPWTPLSKPLEESTVALISSAAIALKTDRRITMWAEHSLTTKTKWK